MKRRHILAMALAPLLPKPEVEPYRVGFEIVKKGFISGTEHSIVSLTYLGDYYYLHWDNGPVNPPRRMS